MTRREQINRNMDLHATLAQYWLRHPAWLDGIPAGASLVLIPEDDRALAAHNRRTLTRLRRQGQSVVVVRMKRPRFPKPSFQILAPTHR